MNRGGTHLPAVGGNSSESKTAEQFRQERREKAAREKEEAERQRAAARERQAGLEEQRRKKEADAALARAQLRREQGDALVRQRAARDKNASLALQQESAQSREKALGAVKQMAWTYLFSAARAGDTDAVRRLLNPPVLPPILPVSGGNKLRPAAPRIEVDLRGKEWVAEELGGGGGNVRGTWLSDPVDVNATGGSMRRSALHGACANGRLEVVRLLCDEFGADIDVQDAVGRCPLWEAAQHGYEEAVDFLVDAEGKQHQYRHV